MLFGIVANNASLWEDLEKLNGPNMAYELELKNLRSTTSTQPDTLGVFISVHYNVKLSKLTSNPYI